MAASATDIRRAAIAAAQRMSRQRMGAFTRAEEQALAADWRDLYLRLSDALQQSAGPDGRVPLDALGRLDPLVDELVAGMRTRFARRLATAIAESATLGIMPMAEGLQGGQMAARAVAFVRNHVGLDGLQLSDRVWRVADHAREVMSTTLRTTITSGHSAAQAARALTTGEAVPADLASALRAAFPDRALEDVGQALFVNPDNAYRDAVRLLRTEVNRAYTEAYVSSVAAHPDVVGMRFTLSPNHPRPDICDYYAAANLHGLGPGVYPPGEHPYPAHPETLSYLQPVFADEIPEEAREAPGGLDWLRRQPPHVQYGVLRSRDKVQALQDGLLRADEVTQPWRIIRPRIEAQSP